MEEKEVYGIPALVMFGFVVSYITLATILLLVVVFVLFGGGA